MIIKGSKKAKSMGGIKGQKKQLDGLRVVWGGRRGE